MSDPETNEQEDVVADVSDDALEDVAGGVSPPGDGPGGDGGSDGMGGPSWPPPQWP